MFKMAAIVGNRSFPVILKEFEPNLDPRVLQIAEVSRKCSILATLESGGRLHLWNIRSGASWSLTCVKQFRWCFFEDSSNEDVHGLLEYPFAVLKSDNSVELFSLSKGAEQLSCVREVIVTKDVLKGLLRDRGKDWLGETDVLSASMDLELAVYEVAVLLDRKFVAILSVSKSEKANMHCCFALDHPDGIKEVPLESIIQVRKCNQFFFTLLYNGVVLIHNMCDLVGSVDVWSTQNIEGEDHMEIQPRPTFCQMEVADNISLLVCTDTSCNVYLVNLDEYLHEQSPQQFSAGGSKFNGSRLEYVRFQYELGDEDSVARDVQMSGVAYGDRVWKTELLAFRRDAKQPCFQDFSDQHQLHSNSLEKQWPVNVLGDKGDCTSSVQLVGQLTRQGTATDGTPDRMLPSQCLQNTQFVPSQTWMELFYVERLSVTPDSFLLWLKAKLLQDQPQSASGSLHGVLCLFSFTSQEFVYHWLSEPSLLVRSCETIQPALLLNSTSLTVPAFDISQDQLVHKVIIYESARLADSLCHVNQWNHCTIPMHALEVALKLRQLDTVAFFLKNQEKAFTNQDVPSLYCSSSSLLSSSPLVPSAARQGQVDVDTTDVKQVTEALVRAVNYNMKQQHNLHFTRQLAQMTLNYLQNLMKDGAGLLDAKCVQDHCDKTESEEVASTPCHQEVKECLEFFTSSTVELRQHVSSMPVDENEIIGPGECGTASFSEMEVDEENEMMRKWTSFNDEEVVKDAVANRQICSAQTFFQCRKQAQRENIQCDGSFASLTRLGLTVVLQKLVDQDMDTAFMLLTNMGRSFLQQVHRICLYTLHRPLRDLLVKELDSRNCLSPTEKEVIEFVHNVEVVYSQPSFTAAKRILEETTDNWKDLGLLQSSFNLGSNHILEMYIKSGNLLSTETNQEGSSNSSHYVEFPLDWAHTWDDLSKQRILVERMLVDKDSSILTCDVRIGTKALWHYLTSHADCQTLLDWIRLTASHEHPMGDTFAVQEGDVVFPSLSQDVLTQLASCLGILKHMVLEELIWNGMYTSFQLSDFSLLLHYMGKTQTLFGDSHPMSTLDRCIGSCTEEPLFDAEGCIVSVTDFHCNFIDYCVRLKLVNLLYHYLDFYRLGETVESVRELKLDLNQPAWIDLLVKFRCLGRYSTDPAAVFEASLSNSGVMVNTPSSSITGMLKAGHPVMAFSCLLYGPTSLNQAISSSGSVAEMSVWQVEESLLFASLAGFPKLRSAVFPVTSGFHGIEPQDVSIYQLLQGNCPFEVSRLFGWQPTNELAHNRDTPYEMPHFSQSILVAQHAHVEGLTFSYYLRHGRPSFAFASFIGDQLKEKTVSKARIQHAAFKAYRVAVQHLTHQEVCSACVAFTEMLGLNSNPLRVDIQAANRVLAHAGKEDLYEIDSPEGKTMENVIASELLSCARKTNRQPKNLLRALESATRNCISKECLDRTSFEAGQLWHLVILFCRVHKIELSTTFLQDCARADKWLPFVCHAHVCQFPKFQVLHVIEREFSNTYIKEHLQLAFDNVLITKIESAAEGESARRGSHKKRPTQKGEQVVKPTRDVRAQFYSRMGLIPGTTSQPCLDGSAEHVTLPSYSSSAEDEDVCRAGIKLSSDYDSEDSKGLKDTDRAGGDYKDKLLCSEDLPHNMFDILFKCQSVEAPWQSLVAHAIALRRSFLSVLAACYKEARVLDCLCAWLCSIVSSSVMKPAVAFIIGSSQTDSADIQSLQWHRWNLHDLSALIFVIAGLKEKLAHTLTRAFYIFDPKSPLVDFFHFYESCLVHSDYEACQEYLNAFKKSHSKMTMKSAGHEKTELPSIGNVEWLESLTIQVTKQMLSQCESTHKQCHLLALLAQSMFGRNFSCQVPNYHKLHEISAILDGTAIEVKLDLLLEENSKGSQDEKERVMHSLLNAKHFGEARRFAVLVDLPDDHITLKEVEADLQRTKNSLLWEIEQGRLAFWHKAEKCFRNNSCDHETVGSFFESQADDEHLSFTERARLLGIAVKWFSIPATDQQPRTAAELRELQKRRWLFKIQAEMENNSEAKLVRSVSHLEFLPHESEVEISDEIRSSNMEAIYHKMASARELVQEDGVDIKSNDECPLKTDKEIRALEHVIGQLLEGCHITQARWLAGLFNHSSLELDVIMSCIHLAQGTRSVETLDDHIQTLLSQKGRRRQSVSRSISRTGRTGSFVFNSNFTESNTGDNLESASSAEWIQVADIIALMESLAFHCRWGKRCCSCIITCYKVAQTLVQDYETIVNEKPFNVLHSLLVSGFDSRYKLIESYIKAMQLDTVEVTKFLADTILKSLRVYSTGEELSGGEYGDLIVNASPSCDDTSHMIRLCPDYSLLGSRLLDTAISLASERASSSITVGGLNLEVELLVRAHECHTLACNMEGIAGVLRNGRMLTAALAEAREYSMLVRLLTGVGRFHEMSYIFDTLFEHEHFELLCRTGIDKENKLKVALLEYLRRQHPDDTDKFSMVAHHFRMYREIAQTLEETAVKQLRSLGDCFPERKDIQGAGEKGDSEVFFKLNSIMKSFCYASDNYAKENCWRHSQSCLRNARLVRLQIEVMSSGVTVVNLDEHALKKFLTYHMHFFQSLLVAEAYKKRDVALWIDAIYLQVVVRGDFNYLQDMRSAMPLTSTLFVDVANKYKSENTRSSQAAANMRRLLGHVNDVRIRYKLATELNFRDLATSILEEDGGAFLRDVMVP